MCIYSQNVNQKYIFVTTLLGELCNLYNILFFQELPWQTVRHTASMKSKKGEPVKGLCLHPHWIPIVPKAIDPCIGRPHIMAYMHRNLRVLKPKKHTDIVNHPDVLLLMLKGPSGPPELFERILRPLHSWRDPAPAGLCKYLSGDQIHGWQF